MTTHGQAQGFSLIEVIIALMILSVGILAMGASTGHVMAQIQAAELRTERMSAVRQAAETLRATDWTNLETVCTVTDTFATDHYDVGCTVDRASSNLKLISVITVGPGFRQGRFSTTTSDTFSISIAKPVQ